MILRWRARDNLAIILEGANEKLSLLALEEETQLALNFIQTVHNKIENENAAFVAKTIRLIELSFSGLGMTEEQENNLIGLITKSQSEFEANFEGIHVSASYSIGVTCFVRSLLAIATTLSQKGNELNSGTIA